MECLIFIFCDFAFQLPSWQAFLAPLSSFIINSAAVSNVVCGPLAIILPRPPESQDYRHAPPGLLYWFVGALYIVRGPFYDICVVNIPVCCLNFISVRCLKKATASSNMFEFINLIFLASGLLLSRPFLLVLMYMKLQKIILGLERWLNS